jgi:hypothetical protein
MRDGGARRKPFEAYVADVAEALLPQLILRSGCRSTAVIEHAGRARALTAKVSSFQGMDASLRALPRDLFRIV